MISIRFPPAEMTRTAPPLEVPASKRTKVDYYHDVALPIDTDDQGDPHHETMGDSESDAASQEAADNTLPSERKEVDRAAFSAW